MENEKIKAIVKEAIEEERKERRKQMPKAILESLMLGSLGAVAFTTVMSMVLRIILIQPRATFADGFVLGAFTIFDIFFIYRLVKWYYSPNQEIESLNENRLSR